MIYFLFFVGGVIAGVLLLAGYLFVSAAKECDEWTKAYQKNRVKRS